MSNAIKKGPKHVSHSLFHHGLVRMLIDHELLKSGRSWEQFVESNGFSSFCHCMFDSPEDCSKHRDSGSAPFFSSLKYPSNPSRKGSEPCKQPMSNPVNSTHTPIGHGCMKKISSLSPVTPPISTDKIGNRRGN